MEIMSTFRFFGFLQEIIISSTHHTIGFVVRVANSRLMFISPRLLRALNVISKSLDYSNHLLTLTFLVNIKCFI